MKKILFVGALLLSVMPVCAADWQFIDTENPNINMFIDTDSVRQTGAQEYVYAVRYQIGNDTEKVVYLKSDYGKNLMGVITQQDYDENNYNPNRVLSDYHVFMKPFRENTLLSYAHKYAGIDTEVALQTPPEPEKSASYTGTKGNVVPTAYQQTVSASVDEYVKNVMSKIQSNWNPPKSGRHTLSKVILTIDSNGSLLNYRFSRLSGDKATDRSIISAIEQSVPFDTFPSIGKKVNNVNIKVDFKYGLVYKSVR